MNKLKLFMLLLGASPKGRHIEQHDIFFGIGEHIRDLVPSIKAFWPEADPKIHIDAWREVTQTDGYNVSVTERSSAETTGARLFFINLGGYKQHEFEEYHYKMIVACPDKGAAIQQAKETAFYKHTGFPGANSHVDDKYGVDVDDVYEITDILPASLKDTYSLILTPANEVKEDELHLGYFKLDRL